MLRQRSSVYDNPRKIIVSYGSKAIKTIDVDEYVSRNDAISLLQPMYTITKWAGLHFPEWRWKFTSWNTPLAILQCLILAIVIVAQYAYINNTFLFGLFGAFGGQTLDALYAVAKALRQIGPMVTWFMAYRGFATGRMSKFLSDVVDLRPIGGFTPVGKGHRYIVPFIFCVLTTGSFIMVAVAIVDAIVEGEDDPLQQSAENETAVGDTIGERFDEFIVMGQTTEWKVAQLIASFVGDTIISMHQIFYMVGLSIIQREARAFNRHVRSTVSTWHSDPKLRKEMFAYYNRLARIVYSADHMFRSFTALSAIVNFFLIFSDVFQVNLPAMIVNCYFLLSGNDGVTTLWLTISNGIIFPLATFIIAVWAPTDIYEEMGQLVKIIHETPTLTDTREYEVFTSMQAMCNRIVDDHPAISFCSLAPITKSLLLTITSALLTYVTLLLQLV